MKEYKYNIGQKVIISGQERMIVKRYLDYGIAGGVEISMVYDLPKKYYSLDKSVRIGNYDFNTVEEKEIDYVVK